MNQEDYKRFLANWNDERNSAALYTALADVEKDTRLAEVYHRMVEVEVRHAARWEKLIAEGGEKLPEFRPAGKTKMLIFLARRLGASFILPSVVGMEQKGTKSYTGQTEAQDFVRG